MATPWLFWDTCVLLPSRLSDVLFDLMLEGLYFAYWTGDVEAELLRNWPQVHPGAAKSGCCHAIQRPPYSNAELVAALRVHGVKADAGLFKNVGGQPRLRLSAGGAADIAGSCWWAIVIATSSGAVRCCLVIHCFSAHVCPFHLIRWQVIPAVCMPQVFYRALKRWHWQRFLRIPLKLSNHFNVWPTISARFQTCNKHLNRVS